jgi:hypothetical protein
MDTMSRHKTNNSKENYSRLINTQMVECFLQITQIAKKKCKITYIV